MRLRSILAPASNNGALAATLLAVSAAAVAAPPPPSSGLASAPLEEHLLGDWFGLLPSLGALGIKPSLQFVTESAGNVTGGRRQGFDYSHQISAGLDINWQKLAGVSGFSTHLAMVQRAGRNASTDYIGDTTDTQVQEEYGAGGNVVAHLVYAYAEEKLFDGRVDILAGRMPYNLRFESSPLYCYSMGLAFCGHQHGLSYKTNWRSWPVNSWGLVTTIHMTPTLYASGGAYNVNALAGGPSGWNLSLDGRGALYPVELGWEPVLGASQLTGHYKLGGYYDTTNNPELFTSVNGQPIPVSHEAGRLSHGRAAFYATFDQMLIRTGKYANEGLVLLGGAAFNDSPTLPYQTEYFAGVIDQGALESRPDDIPGLFFTYERVADKLTRLQELQQTLGEKLAGNASGVQSFTMVLEANYDARLYEGIHLIPDIQYVIRPDATSRYGNALVLGLKTRMAL